MMRERVNPRSKKRASLSDEIGDFIQHQVDL